MIRKLFWQSKTACKLSSDFVNKLLMGYFKTFCEIKVVWCSLIVQWVDWRLCFCVMEKCSPHVSNIFLSFIPMIWYNSFRFRIQFYKVIYRTIFPSLINSSLTFDLFIASALAVKILARDLWKMLGVDVIDDSMMSVKCCEFETMSGGWGVLRMLSIINGGTFVQKK